MTETAAPASAQASHRTDLAAEREEQRRWRLRPRHAGLKVFDRLVENEFLPVEEQGARQAAALARTVGFAAAEVPYYRDLFAARGLGPEDVRAPEDLVKLPLLDKSLIGEHEKRLRPARLPRGERVYGVFSTSGTTGQPARIVQTARSNAMFTYLNQRHYRWFRFNPEKTLAFLRFPGDLPPTRGGRRHPDGVTLRLSRWRYVGAFFETGPWLALTMTTPVECQIEWLRAHRPAYLGTHSSWLEQLCFAAAGEAPVWGLESIQAISEDLGESTRRYVERVFGAPVHQSYGMNEVGLMAVRCAAGRYHVHTEHCLIEILDEEGRACAPGETGRIAVTALSNPAMPLIRYDTDDMAEALAGPCPCGRTLPSFGEVVGRYRRYVSLPPGSYHLFLALRTAVNDMPRDLLRHLRRFQVHQFRDGHFELRLATAGPLPGAFYERVRAAWDAAIGKRTETLEIAEVAEIPRPPGGKFQDFTSDFMPAPDREAAPPPVKS